MITHSPAIQDVTNDIFGNYVIKKVVHASQKELQYRYNLNRFFLRPNILILISFIYFGNLFMMF